jgi:cellulose 1,4-beta-cellobiosidase
MNSAVGVSWWPNTEPDIAGYNIYWWDEVTQSTTSKHNSSLITGTTFYDGGLTNGTSYTYVITAVDTAENESWYSQPRTTTPYATDTIPAGPVTGLKGYSGEEFINLFWTKNLELDVLYYKIYRSTYSCPISQKSLIATILHPGTTHQDTGLLGGVTYYYQITNVDTSNNESIPSDEISVLVLALVNPPPLAPTGFVAVPSSGVVYLKWNKNSEPDLNGYRLYRSTYPGGYSLVVGTTTLTASTSIYTDTGLTNGITYFYRLTALDIAGNESSYSTEVTAKPDELIECVFSVDMRSQGATVTSVQIVSNLIWPPWTPQTTQLTNNGNNIWFKTLYLPKANNMQYKYVMNGTVWKNDFPDGPSIYRDIFISSNNPDGKMYNSNV